MDVRAALEAAPTRQRPRTAGQALVGGRCRVCGRSVWPMRAVCYHCGSAEVDQAPLARGGMLLSCTTVMVPRPGMPDPYVLGQVRIDDGPMVFGRVMGLEDLDVVPCRVITMVDGDDFWFVPEGAP